ncbi:hypothetical protein V5O48_015655 [Marasmius crinis-equi]|uniref:PLD phosphodiesterase domain-containing protein n=1 Tax=Marasmius crinis-equi TaxID=585013 RepID=A0ABR3ETX5_9AGAR
MAALANTDYRVYALAGTQNSNLPRSSFKLATSIFQTLCPAADQMVLIQGITPDGDVHLLARLTDNDASMIGLGVASALSFLQVRQTYSVLSPVTFNAPQQLRKKIDVILRQQKIHSTMSTSHSNASDRESQRCEYERGRLFKAVAIENHDCSQYFFGWDAFKFQALSKMRVAALYLTSSDGDGSVLDLGLAFAEICLEGSGLVPIPSATRRFKNELNVNGKQTDMVEVEYPSQPDQSETTPLDLFGQKIVDLLCSPPSAYDIDTRTLILLVHDAETTLTSLSTLLGLKTDGWTMGLAHLFRSLEGLPNANTQDHSSGSASFADHPSLPFVHVIDVQALYVGASNMYTGYQWFVPNTAADVGFKVSPKMFWNGAAYAELLIEAFNRLIHGEAVNTPDALHKASSPQQSSVHPITSAPEEDESDFSDYGSDKY